MSVINLRNTIKEYIDSADIRLLKMMKALAETYQSEIDVDSIEDYNMELDSAIEEIENGNFYTQKEVEEHSKKW